MNARFNGKQTDQIRSEARLDANAVLDVHWDNRIPVDPFHLATNLGPEVFTAQLGDDVYGLITGPPHNAQIYLDVDQSPNRLRFSCAHELGHYVDRSSSLTASAKDFAKIDKRSDSGAGSPSEIYANEFAAALLMPEVKVRELHKSGMSRVQMAHEFQVSLGALKWRLVNLGLEPS